MNAKLYGVYLAKGQVININGKDYELTSWRMCLGGDYMVTLEYEKPYVYNEPLEKDTIFIKSNELAKALRLTIYGFC